MSKIFFISDLHLGHKRILEFSPERGGTDVISHSEWLVQQWNSVVTKNDLVWVLGDVCFDKTHLKYLKRMKGTKHLILGNHDQFPLDTYLQYFNKIHGLMKYKGHWLSHAPVHEGSLRNLCNIHGHVHANSVQYYNYLHNTLEDEYRYINVCVEANNGVPQTLEDLNAR